MAVSLAVSPPAEPRAVGDARGTERERRSRQARAEVRYLASQRAVQDEQQRAATTVRQEHLSSREARHLRLPYQLAARLLWFKRELELAMPEELHGAGVWTDTVTGGERAIGIRPQGGSLIGTHRYSAEMRQLLEGSPHQKDDQGDHVHPLRSAFARLRTERPLTADLLTHVAMAGFDWRALIDKPFYRRRHDETRVLVAFLPEDALAWLLHSGLERLWELLMQRTPYLRSDE